MTERKFSGQVVIENGKIDAVTAINNIRQKLGE
jgi:hypothetical protein